MADTTCGPPTGAAVTAYKTTSGSIDINDVLYNSPGGTTLATGFYSDGTYRYVVNTGTVTNKIICPSLTPTPTPSITSTNTPTPSRSATWFGLNLTPVFDDVTCTPTGAADVTGYYTHPGSPIVGDSFYSTTNMGSPLTSGFYSSGIGGLKYNVQSNGVISAINSCTVPSPTPTKTPTVTPTPSPSPAPLVWNLYYPCGTTTPAAQVIAYTPNYLGGEIIKGSNGLCYTVAVTGRTTQTPITVVSEHSTCADCLPPTPTPTPTRTPTMTPTPAAITATISSTNVSCNGGSNGSITITNVSGGFGGPYQTKNGVGGTYTPWTSSTTYSSLAAGSYTIYVKDSASREVTFSVTITQPNVLGIFAQKTAFDQIYASVSGGASGSKTFELYRDYSSPYEIGGGSLVDTLYNSSSVTFSSVVAGYYYVKAIDNNGCTETTAYIITM